MSEQISINVDGPDGLTAPSVTLVYKPQTADDFDAIIDALGGPLAFRAGGTNYAHTRLDSGAFVMVYTPTDVEPPKPVQEPFMRAFEQRIKECSDFRDRLEATTTKTAA